MQSRCKCTVPGQIGTRRLPKPEPGLTRRANGGRVANQGSRYGVRKQLEARLRILRVHVEELSRGERAGLGTRSHGASAMKCSDTFHRTWCAEPVTHHGGGSGFHSASTHSVELGKCSR